MVPDDYSVTKELQITLPGKKEKGSPDSSITEPIILREELT